MIRNYFKIALRNLLKSKGYSAINIGGLSVGMAVAVLIGLWIYDEVSFDNYHRNHNRIGQVWQYVQFGPEKSSYNVVPLPLAADMKEKYPDFEAISKSAYRDIVISNGDKMFSKSGQYVQPSFTKMMSVRIVAGSDNLKDVNSILLSESFARLLFGNANPVNSIVKLNSNHDVRVAGVFEDIPNNSGLIEFVWLFGTIGFFVLLLACINFMNLSTARSEKRAKEVGIRKAIGSMRSQLVNQFFSESMLVVALSFILSLLLSSLVLSFFNEVAEKKIAIPWSNPMFWAIGIGFSLITGVISGSYPAIYLSSFQPLKVLKGTMRAGRFAAIPRQVLVVLQFTVSVTLIIGTLVVFRQIQFAKNRPVGYTRNGLIEVSMNTPELYGHYDAIRNDLLNTGAVREMSESYGSVTVQYGGTTNVSWEGKSRARSHW
jgi:hypothetical protein